MDLSDASFNGMDMKAKQAAYHDFEAQTYEGKFGIAYDQRCIDYAVERFRKVVEPELGPDPKVFGRILEVGAGTGFFSINLFLGGRIGGEIHATDISEGMLTVCKGNGAEHGIEILTKQGDAEALPYDDNQFDLVLGHAFIHHLPVPGLAIREMLRVLKPGGMLVIAGEPTLWGDRIAHVVKRSTWRTFRAVTSLPGLKSIRRASLEAEQDPQQAILAALEHEVDLHEFRPDEVAHMAQ
ncbi:MAG: ubiquinone/menaquinone biosynthesis C-methylase UbiE, partial [Glaciecola sp.]